jgi:hypothetical protein
MKLLSLFLVFVFLLSSTVSAQEKQNPLEGTWELVSGKYTWADTTITESASESSGHAKIINKTHFATLFNGSTITPSFFNGGKYDFTEDTYTEHIEYWLSDTTKTYIGHSFTFESKKEGDQWTISGPIETTGESLPPWKVHEVFKRID